MNKCYIASGWFSPEWLEELENIKTTLDDAGLDYFSPKDENLCDPDSDVGFQDQVFEGNISGMEDCDWMLCNTRNKDMGTIFEAGYFHRLGKPIIYFCAGLPEGAQFNLMLAASGAAVCTSLDDLAGYLFACKESGDSVLTRRYGGKIE
jgi:nucleoside 2-deoxyribosyltransferase